MSKEQYIQQYITNRMALIGKGTYGCVYETTNIMNNQLYVVKEVIIDCDDNKDIQIEKEIQVMEKMNQNQIPNIVEYVQSFYWQEINSNLDYFAIVMKKYPFNLLQKLKQMKINNQIFDKDTINKIISQLLTTFHLTMNKEGIYHRDIKPQNILIDDQNNIFITDFGECKVSQMVLKGQNSLTFKQIRGTPDYVSPVLYLVYKQLLPEDTKYSLEKSDTFSVGLVILQVVNGLISVTGFNQRQNIPKLEQEVQQIQEKGIQFLVRKMLEYEESDRFNMKSSLEYFDSYLTQQQIINQQEKKKLILQQTNENLQLEFNKINNQNKQLIENLSLNKQQLDETLKSLSDSNQQIKILNSLNNKLCNENQQLTNNFQKVNQTNQNLNEQLLKNNIELQQQNKQLQKITDLQQQQEIEEINKQINDQKNRQDNLIIKLRQTGYAISNQFQEIKQILKGLPNIGNTSFLNSVLQLLKTNSKLLKIIEKNDKKQKGDLSQNLNKFYKKFLYDQADQLKKILPDLQNLTLYLENHLKPEYRFQNQYDVFSLLNFILCQIQDEEQYQNSQEISDLSNNQDEQNLNLKDLFQIKLTQKQISKCNCKPQDQFDQYSDIQFIIDIKIPGSNCDFQQLINQNINKNIQLKDEKCPECQKFEIYENMEIESLSENLLINIIKNNKNKNKIQIPLNISIKLKNQSEYKYKFKGCIIYEGNNTFGHYTTVLQHNHPDQLYLFNDDSLSPFYFDSLDLQQSKILAFEKINEE